MWFGCCQGNWSPLSYTAWHGRARCTGAANFKRNITKSHTCSASRAPKLEAGGWMRGAAEHSEWYLGGVYRLNWGLPVKLLLTSGIFIIKENKELFLRGVKVRISFQCHRLLTDSCCIVDIFSISDQHPQHIHHLYCCKKMGSVATDRSSIATE